MAGQPNSIILPSDAVDVQPPSDALGMDSVTAQARQRQLAPPAPNQDRGPAQRFANGLGIPTSLGDLSAAMPWNRAVGAYNNFASGNPAQGVSDVLGMASPALNAIANIYTNAATGNTAGALGGAAGIGMAAGGAGPLSRLGGDVLGGIKGAAGNIPLFGPLGKGFAKGFADSRAARFTPPVPDAPPSTSPPPATPPGSTFFSPESLQWLQQQIQSMRYNQATGGRPFGKTVQGPNVSGSSLKLPTPPK